MKIVIELYRNEKFMKYPSILELSMYKDKQPYEAEELVLKSRESIETNNFLFKEDGITYKDDGIFVSRTYEILKNNSYDSIYVYEDGELILEKELD